MKEAAGEANLTVVAIILIGVVVAVVTPLINNMMKGTAGRACSTNGGGSVDGTTCVGGTYNGRDINGISQDASCTG